MYTHTHKKRTTKKKGKNMDKTSWCATPSVNTASITEHAPGSSLPTSAEASLH